MEFIELNVFQKEFRKLCKKYKTLDDDFKKLKGVIETTPRGNGEKHWNILKRTDDGKELILKVRLYSRYLRAKEMRVIYFYDSKRNVVVFIQIYHKNVSAVEDRKRINDFWAKKNCILK